MQKQQTILHGTATADGNLDFIRPEERTRQHGRRDPPQRGRRGPPPKHCTRCGKEPHPRDSTARSADLKTSTSQLSRRHFRRNDLASGRNCMVRRHLGRNEKVTFKLDTYTGAEVTAESQETYEQLRDAPPLNTPETTLCGPSRKPLKVRGQCQMQLIHKVASSKQQVFVVEGLKSNLLA